MQLTTTVLVFNELWSAKKQAKNRIKKPVQAPPQLSYIIPPDIVIDTKQANCA